MLRVFHFPAEIITERDEKESALRSLFFFCPRQRLKKQALADLSHPTEKSKITKRVLPIR